LIALPRARANGRQATSGRRKEGRSRKRRGGREGLQGRSSRGFRSQRRSLIRGASRGPAEPAKKPKNERSENRQTEFKLSLHRMDAAMREFSAVRRHAVGAAPALGWEHWGGDRGGRGFRRSRNHVGQSRQSRAAGISHRDLDTRSAVMARTKFEATPCWSRTGLDFRLAVQRGDCGRSRPAARKKDATIRRSARSDDRPSLRCSGVLPTGSTSGRGKRSLTRAGSWAPTTSA